MHFENLKWRNENFLNKGFIIMNTWTYTRHDTVRLCALPIGKWWGVQIFYSILLGSKNLGFMYLEF